MSIASHSLQQIHISLCIFPLRFFAQSVQFTSLIHYLDLDFLSYALIGHTSIYARMFLLPSHSTSRSSVSLIHAFSPITPFTSRIFPTSLYLSMALFYLTHILPLQALFLSFYTWCSYVDISILSPVSLCIS